MKKPNTLSKEDELLVSLLEVCQIYRTPMFAGLSPEADDLSCYRNIVYSAQSHIIRLFHDNIRKHMLVANGFEVLSSPVGKNKDGLAEKGRRPTIYDCDKYQRKEIAEKIGNIFEYAKKNNLYFFASVAVMNKDGETEYLYESYMPAKEGCKNGISRRIMQHLRIEKEECDAVPERENIMIDMSEVIG